MVLMALSVTAAIPQGNHNTCVTSLSNRIGDVLPSTGTPQEPPEIVNVAAVAPDVLCIEISACRILPPVQIPYVRDSSDVITVKNYSPMGEKNTIRVTRNGFPLGMLVGPGQKTITIYERLAGRHLDSEKADNPASYMITSPHDINYKRGALPLKVWRKPNRQTTRRRTGTEVSFIPHSILSACPSHSLERGRNLPCVHACP